MELPVDILHAALLHLNDPVVITESNYTPEVGRRIVFVNEAFCRMCGYSAGELIGRTPKMLHGPGTDTAEIKRVGRALREARPIRAEMLNYRKGGQPYWVELSISPLRDGEGRLTHFVAVERELHGRSGGQVSATPDFTETVPSTYATSHVLWDADVVADRMHWFTELSNLFGYDPRELPKSVSGWLELVHPDDRSELAASMAGPVNESSRSWTAKVRIKAVHGAYTEIRVMARVVDSVGDLPGRLIGSIQDLSERGSARAQILELADQLTSVVESIADSLLVVDNRGVITFMNSKAAVMLGTGRSSIGQHWLTVLPGAKSSALHDAFVTACETLNQQHTECYNPELNIWLEADFFPADNSVSIFFRDITYRVRAEDDLRKALKEVEHARVSLQWIYDHTLDVICTMDREGKVVDISASSYAVFGYHPEEVRGRYGFDFVHPGDLESTMASYQRTLGGEVVSGFLNRMLHKDGSVVHVMWSSRWYEENQVTVAVARDVTESQQFHQLVESERNELSRAQRMARMGTWRLQSASGRLELSGEIIRMFQWREHEVPETIAAFLRYVHPEDREHLESAVEVAEASRNRKELVIRVLPTRDHMLVVSVVSEQNYDATTGESVFFGTMQDQTEQIRLRESLLESEIRFKQVFEHSPVALYLLDKATQHVIAANESARTLYGYTEPEFLSLRLEDLMGSPDVTMPIESTSYEQRRADGTNFPAQLFANDMEYLGKTAQLVVALDLTDQRKLEEQLRQSTKMEAIGQLAGGIAHDFNNLLTVISGFTLMAMEDAQDHPECLEKLGYVRDASTQAAGLTKQLLAFSRKQVLKPTFITVAELLDGLKPLLQRLLPENVEIRYNRRNADTVIHGDPVQIQQVLMNLAINARDAMPNGGRLTIETAILTQRSIPGTADIDRMQPGQYVMLAVSDTGVGMTREVRERAFEPFFTTKPKGQGTGLGLATVYGIVRQMGGDAHIYSEPNRGTTVRVYLPVHRAPVVVEAPPEPRREIAARRGLMHALVVEDDVSVRDYVSQVLAGAGYSVTTATDGRDATVQASRPDRPAFELLVTDVVLPKVSGRELATTIRGLLPDIAVVFMSGYTEDAIVNQGVLDPGIHFLSKPFTPEELLDRVNEAITSERRPLGSTVLLYTNREGVKSKLVETLAPSGHCIYAVRDHDELLRHTRESKIDLVLLDLAVGSKDESPVYATQLMAEVRASTFPARIVAIECEGVGAAERKWPAGLVPDATLPTPIEGARVLAVVRALLDNHDAG